MDRKRGILLLILASVVVIVIAGSLIFVLLNEDSSSDDSELEGISDSNDSQIVIPEPVNCSDYETQEDCELNSYALGNCVWDSNNSSCELAVEEVNETENLFLDLAAIDINLISDECDELTNSTTNETYKECDLDIEGTLKNNGTQSIETRFVVHFLDVTGATIFIESIAVDETLAPGDEKTLSIRYDDIGPGEYVIRFRVDGASNIAEVDEDNNIKSDFVTLS